jgi:phosphoglycerate dehydrogenase-like enzyme
MINKLTVGVTTVAFSKNKALITQLKNMGFKNVIINDDGKRFTKNELISILSKCDVAIVGLDKIDKSILSQTPKLKVISKYGVGLDNINFDDCKKHGVNVLYSQGINKRSVSEMTLGFILGLARNLIVTSNLLKNGTWKKDGGILLSGKTVGIIGVGNIGKDLISLLKPFNCEILVNDIVEQKTFYIENNLTEVSKEFIFKNADFITVHVPFNGTTKNIINKKSLSTMKSSSFVINTARAGIVNQEDLKWALQNKIIAGAAIDVYDKEPPKDNDILLLPNLINTPHIGGNAKEAVEAMGVSAIDNILKWLTKFN